MSSLPSLDPAAIDWDQVIKHSDNLILIARRMNKERWNCASCGSHQLRVRNYSDLGNIMLKCRECPYVFYKDISPGNSPEEPKVREM